MSWLKRKATYTVKLVAYWFRLASWWLWWHLGIRTALLALFPFVALVISDKAIQLEYTKLRDDQSRRLKELHSLIGPAIEHTYDHAWNLISSVADREWDRRQALEDKARHFIDRYSLEVAVVASVLAVLGLDASHVPDWLKVQVSTIHVVLGVATLCYYLVAYRIAALCLRVGVVHLVQPREVTDLLATRASKDATADALERLLVNTELNASSNDRKAQYVTAADECKRNSVVLAAVLALIMLAHAVSRLNSTELVLQGIPSAPSGHSSGLLGSSILDVDSLDIRDALAGTSSAPPSSMMFSAWWAKSSVASSRIGPSSSAGW